MPGLAAGEGKFRLQAHAFMTAVTGLNTEDAQLLRTAARLGLIALLQGIRKLQGQGLHGELPVAFSNSVGEGHLKQLHALGIGCWQHFCNLQQIFARDWPGGICFAKQRSCPRSRTHGNQVINRMGQGLPRLGATGRREHHVPETLQPTATQTLQLLQCLVMVAGIVGCTPTQPQPCFPLTARPRNHLTQNGLRCGWCPTAEQCLRTTQHGRYVVTPWETLQLLLFQAL